eukprot:CAMPEP_0176276536 /NCGR_PEP_ID=MMETSP0121_2-20121125/47804_1 /TAXON_ID=160619 /ORGANISM="Kryptoperidinium foliaceum, Strain CCMP 1326" /LENGTH=186 /DNA_ID=CAMNT_0017616791 /DNA_START=406 /DNA_END=963 /DNA_ORIENTATION=+
MRAPELMRRLGALIQALRKKIPVSTKRKRVARAPPGMRQGNCEADHYSVACAGGHAELSCASHRARGSTRNLLLRRSHPQHTQTIGRLVDVEVVRLRVWRVAATAQHLHKGKVLLAEGGDVDDVAAAIDEPRLALQAAVAEAVRGGDHADAAEGKPPPANDDGAVVAKHRRHGRAERRDGDEHPLP